MINVKSVTAYPAGNINWLSLFPRWRVQVEVQLQVRGEEAAKVGL
jgi:hypothetical protein